MGSAGLRALVVLSDASCVGRESLHACCEFAGIEEFRWQKKDEELLGIPDQHRHDHDEQERRHRTSLTNSEMLVMRT